MSLDGLEALQRAQSYAIPFENFDVLLGRGISLDPDHLVEKLVRSKRGGYCFELNGLFLRALRAQGYNARALLGRVHVGGEITGRGHLFCLVEIDGTPYIADVGFGGVCPRAPIPFEFGRESEHDGSTFRLQEHDFGYMVQLKDRGEWGDLYSFDLSQVLPNDIAYGNHFTSSHPSSFFTFARVASLANPNGRTALFNFRCTTESNAPEAAEEFPDSDEYLTLLEKRFGIVLDANYRDLGSPPGPPEAS